MKKKHKNCKCLMCNSKCPSCGSTNIEVHINAHFSYWNEEEDEIDISYDELESIINCMDCGRDFSGEETEKLNWAIDQNLKLTGCTVTYEDGTCTGEDNGRVVLLQDEEATEARLFN